MVLEVVLIMQVLRRTIAISCVPLELICVKQVIVILREVVVIVVLRLYIDIYVTIQALALR